MERHRRPIPPPPPEAAEILSSEETAGFLRVPLRGLQSLRLKDATFPEPFIVGKGRLRWRRADLVAWFEGLKRGWAERGSRSKGATC
jgi:hypothetical protein